MSKQLQNAVAKLKASGSSDRQILDLVSKYLSQTYVDHRNIADHLEAVVRELPGWMVVEPNPAHGLRISNGRGLTFHLGESTGRQLHVGHEYLSFLPSQFYFDTPAISVRDLAGRIEDLDHNVFKAMSRV